MQHKLLILPLLKVCLLEGLSTGLIEYFLVGGGGCLTFYLFRRYYGMLRRLQYVTQFHLIHLNFFLLLMTQLLSHQFQCLGILIGRTNGFGGIVTPDVMLVD